MTVLFGSSFLLLIPAIILAGYAQWKVRSTYAKYSTVAASNRITAQQTAERILANAMISDVDIETSQRALSDHYDPTKKILSLSAPDSSSLSAVGIAAHEAGHAIQHSQNYAPLTLRTSIVPIAKFGSQLALPLFFLGIFTQASSFITFGIIAFSAAVLFTLITLPVEFDASRRAIVALRANHIVNEEEIGGVKEVLFAAALTYVAAAAMAGIQLLMMLSARRRR